jgi:hypothetical protein
MRPRMADEAADPSVSIGQWEQEETRTTPSVDQGDLAFSDGVVSS